MSLLNDMEELEILAGEYDSKHGSGKADSIIGSLMVSHSTREQINIFKKAGDREIIIDVDDDVIDGIKISYK
jgi:hypothetical protein